MAEVFRPVYTATDPATGRKVKRKSRRWWIRYYTPDGERHKVKGYRDKKATEAKAAELEKPRRAAGCRPGRSARRSRQEAASRTCGRLPPATWPPRGTRPITSRSTLARLTLSWTVAVSSGSATFNRPPLMEFLGATAPRRQEPQDRERLPGRRQGLHALALAGPPRSGLTRWPACPNWRTGKPTFATPAATWPRTELTRLLEAARKSRKAIRKLTGRDRHFLYLTACATGFRASELASLTPESFDLDGDTPTVTVEAACTKNRKLAVQPLPRDVADAPWPCIWPTSRPANRSGPASGAARPSLCSGRDLAEARQDVACRLPGCPPTRRSEPKATSWPTATRTGRYADFHALRHTFITMIGKTGV